ncbi:MAG: LCP family protein, partial [Clostridiales bacterium]|nr:LCP family protein [Clostridiales bacterium]
MRRRHEQRKRTGGQTTGRRSGSPQYDDGKTSSRRNRRVTRRRKRIPMIPFLAAIVILAGGFFAYRHFFGTGSAYWTIAVFGLDSRDGNLGKGALSDVEMLCTIDRSTGEIRLASVFRDTYLKIDSDGTYDKTNEAYFLGGPEQAIHTLQDNMDLHIDNYASFNWKAIVDAINI